MTGAARLSALPSREHCTDGVLSFTTYHELPDYPADEDRRRQDLADVAVAWRDGGSDAASKVALEHALVAWAHRIEADKPETRDAFGASVRKTKEELVRAGLALLADYYAHFE